MNKPGRYIVAGSLGAMALSRHGGPGLFFCCGNPRRATEFSSRAAAKRAIDATIRRSVANRNEPPHMTIYRLEPK